MQIQTNQFQKEVKKHGETSFPILVSYEQLSHYESCSFLWHWHPELEFTIITKGSMTYQINQQLFHATEGSVLFCNANALHTGHMTDKQDCEYLSVTLDSKLISGFHGSILEQNYVNPIIQNPSLSGFYFDMSQNWHKDIREQLKKIVSLYEKQSPLFEFDITIKLQSLWKTLYTNTKTLSASSQIDQLSHDRILTMMHYIEQHYMEKITLDNFSDLLHISSCECSRLFKRNMNVTLFSFVQEYRIERSTELLLSSDLSITEIAARTGFSDSNFFTKTFLKIKSCTPTAYRKAHLHN